MFGKKEPRTCEAGHPQEDTWEQCPFCEASRLDPSAPRDETGGDDGASGAVLIHKKRADAPRPLAGWLVALDGEQAGDDFRILGGRNVIGKGEAADVRVRDAHLTKHHAALDAHEGGRYELRDLGSKYGTFVNDVQVEDARPLHDGDVIRLGKIRLKFKSFA